MRSAFVLWIQVEVNLSLNIKINRSHKFDLVTFTKLIYVINIFFFISFCLIGFGKWDKVLIWKYILLKEPILLSLDNISIKIDKINYKFVLSYTQVFEQINSRTFSFEIPINILRNLFAFVCVTWFKYIHSMRMLTRKYYL